MSTSGDRAAMKELLKGVSDLEVRELSIEGLRDWRKGHPNETQVAMHGALGLELRNLLLKRRTTPFPYSGMVPQEALIDAVTEPGLDGVAEFVNWFVRAGLAWPLGAPNQCNPSTSGVGLGACVDWALVTGAGAPQVAGAFIDAALSCDAASRGGPRGRVAWRNVAARRDAAGEAAQDRGALRRDECRRRAGSRPSLPTCARQIAAPSLV